VDQQASVTEGSSLEELAHAARGRGSVAVTAPPPSSIVTVIDADKPRTRVELGELWRARELALSFAWRDVKVRYKQSLIGFGWAIIQPLTTMVVFTVIFGKFAKFSSEGLPYPIFVYLGLLPWTFFSSVLSSTGSCLMANRVLVQKVYFPRLILPLSSLLVPAVDFTCSFLILIGMMFYFGVGFQATAPIGLACLLLLSVTALGVGSMLATINARYRDVPYAIPFLIQTWLYLSPVIYAFSSLPSKWRLLLSFNPMVAAIGGFRWAFLGTPPPSPLALGGGITVALLLLLAGFLVFRSAEARFADTV
jgi:lipopolysaccharide transport system permease protein